VWELRCKRIPKRSVENLGKISINLGKKVSTFFNNINVSYTSLFLSMLIKVQCVIRNTLNIYIKSANRCYHNFVFWFVKVNE